ncbi:MAG TPA: peptidase M28 family protein, partial [Thermoanaerobaculia bacterium]
MRFARCRLSVLGCLAVAVVAQAQTADDIIKRELATAQAYDTLEYLSDNIGPRLSGSTNAAAAVRWATSTFQKWGIS